MSQNYTTLTAAVAAFMERVGDVELAAYTPTFIENAQARIAQKLKFLPALQFVTDSLTPGTTGAVIAKPARWRTTLYANYAVGAEGAEDTAPYTKRRTLLKRDYLWCRNYWPDQTVTGEPKFYADYGGQHWLIVPTPRTAWPFEIGYFEVSPPITSTNQSNWLCDFAPNLVLYAVLLEASVFVKNDVERAKYQSLYDDAVASLTTESMMQLGDGTTGPMGA